MIVKAFLPVNFVTTYHTEHLDKKQVSRSIYNIKNRKSYKIVKEDIIKNGILDPVIAMVTPTRPCMVEIGEERVLIARELGIKDLLGIVYTKDQGKISFEYERKLENFDEIKELFKTVNPIGLEIISNYIEANIMVF